MDLNSAGAEAIVTIPEIFSDLYDQQYLNF